MTTNTHVILFVALGLKKDEIFGSHNVCAWTSASQAFRGKRPVGIGVDFQPIVGHWGDCYV